MKYALVDGERREAERGLAGHCPGCGSPMVAKCGERRVDHWAHASRRECDPWWESETEWHRAWKNQFPAEWQEVVHRADDGERHIADVKTPHGWVLEFQHSALDPEEHRSRETFYSRLIWVVDGTRRRRDATYFASAWGAGKARDPFSDKRITGHVHNALFEEWRASLGHVFFDFGEPQLMWWLFPDSSDERAYLRHVPREHFVRVLRDRGLQSPIEFDAWVQDFVAFIAMYEPTTAVASQPTPSEALLPPHRSSRYGAAADCSAHPLSTTHAGSSLRAVHPTFRLPARRRPRSLRRRAIESVGTAALSTRRRFQLQGGMGDPEARFEFRGGAGDELVGCRRHGPDDVSRQCNA
jgi:competence protein CoiA